MATLALAAAGAAAGGALFPAGISLFGATIAGATVGAQAGALAGSIIDQALFAGSGGSRDAVGPRLSDLRVTSSTEGAPIPRLYGRARVGGQVIWATDFEETVVTTESGGSGKGVAAGGGSAEVTEFRYFANFAVALAEGEVSGLGRVWVDGSAMDLSQITYRLYTGREDQEPDSLIAAHEGVDAAPAYRGLAYIVFERLPIGPYGNRIPQLSFEVHRAIDRLNSDIRGVVIIPGSGEFAYASTPVTRSDIGNERPAENVHTHQAASDWLAGIDQLETVLPNAKSASLVVSWFGTDLRAGQCDIKPGVELAVKSTHPRTWRVAGLTRSEAHLVSQKDGRPAYGGTPTDDSVIEAIQDLKARGFAATLTPFILMDVGDDNALDDPYAPGQPQPAYPWRGRITVAPAAGQPGSADQTAAAAAQVATFVGMALPTDFSLSGNTVVYGGPDEWSFRRHILHYAWLALAAGGVDAFVIGTELRGLTQVRDGAGSYPFVSALVQLAADVKSILGPETKVTYAADWSEYFGHQPQDGSGDVFFHLDPLWSSSDVDAIGIDLYWPLADWRSGNNHLDAVAGAGSAYDLDYLKGNIARGEGFDWYYASVEDRAAQVRTPITDGAGKPWVFRFKDIRSWWLNTHHNRPGGIEAVSATAWVPQSKPFWIMETGCPAIDNGANQPNVFVDPKSAESAYPYFSKGRRDDFMQRQYLKALVEGLDPEHSGYVEGLNPSSSVYDGRMVDTERVHVYAWDARPYPAFPYDTETWSDGANWRLGHWLNGRMAGMSLADTLAAILTDSGFEDFDASRLYGVVPGYIGDSIMSARDALQPLELAYFLDAVESGGRITFRHRGNGGIAAHLTSEHLAERRGETAAVTLVRRQETDLPASAKISYLSATGDYDQAVVEARRLTVASVRVAQAQLPLVLEPEQATALAESWLFETWTAREQARFTVGPAHLALEPGDTIEFETGDAVRQFRITEIGEHGDRDITALSFDRSVYDLVTASGRRTEVSQAPAVGQPAVEFLDLPLLRGDEPDTVGYACATLQPWPGPIAFFRSPEDTGYALAATAVVPATLGRTIEALAKGPVSRIDRGNTILVKLDAGALYSATPLHMLGGANAAALAQTDGGWEVIQFEAATLVEPGVYRLAGLLRGQAGSESEMSDLLAAGARFVLLGSGLTQVSLAPAEIGLPLNWKYGPAARDIGHSSYGTAIHTFTGLGRRPLSPVHARATRSGGDAEITWVRRTRRGGDSWDGTDVPLSEEYERYEVDILDGATVRRTLAANEPHVVYAEAQQIADFGAPQAAVSVAIHQVNSAFGRGAALAAVV